jgi:diguanylate cyclase (GGDEF)-like protein
MTSNSGIRQHNVEINQLVLHEQAATLLAGLRTSLLASSFIACSFALMIWGRLPAVLLACWLTLILTINAMRFVAMCVAVRRHYVDTRTQLVLTTSWIAALVSGGAWGLLLIFVDIYDLNMSPAIAFVVCGISAGAVIQGSTHRKTVWAFIIPLVGTHFVCLVSEMKVGPLILATNVGLFLVMMCRSAVAAERSYVNASRLKHEATDLAANLKTANDTASAAVKRLEFLAHHDPLTGLANRNAFNQVFSAALTEATARGNEIALILIDLDRFKAINDKFGHAVGDIVLIEVGDRLRRFAPGATMCARLGGDEFAVILVHETVETDAQSLVAALIDQLNRPIGLADRQLAIGASIGYSQFPRDGQSVAELQVRADVALYAAKTAGRGIAHAFDAKLRATTDARRVFELDLEAALKNRELDVWFQPQVSLADGKPVGLESLIRWKHPRHGWVSPPEIVAAALATRQSEALTGFVVAASCRMIRALTEAGFEDVSVSFNVSPQEMGHYPLVELIMQAIAREGIEPRRLEVEITEDAMFDEDRGGDDLRAIGAMGVKLAVDDFGVAYSSFGALRSHKFDCIKIDKVFIDGVTDGANDRALVKALLGVARALGVKAIAEGVETAEQARVLASLGCTEAQGYYFAKPMPFAAALDWLERDRGNAAAKMSPLGTNSEMIRQPLRAAI